MQNPPGSKMLRVVGILLVIFGGFMLLGLPEQFTDEQVALYGGYQTISLILSILGAATFLVAGILGIAQGKQVSKANIFIALGGGLILISLASSIIDVLAIPSADINSILEELDLVTLSQTGLEAVKNSMVPTLIVSAIFSLVLPILYLIGAFRLKGAVSKSDNIPNN